MQGPKLCLIVVRFRVPDLTPVLPVVASNSVHRVMPKWYTCHFKTQSCCQHESVTLVRQQVTVPICTIIFQVVPCYATMYEVSHRLQFCFE